MSPGVGRVAFVTETAAPEMISEALAVIDQALPTMQSRALVSTDEVADLLLDLRLLLATVPEPAPVVGVALTAEIAVPGSATGASSEHDIAQAARFAVEVAKSFGRGRAAFYDPTEFARLVELYGPMTHLQRRGAATGADAWGVDPSKARP